MTPVRRGRLLLTLALLVLWEGGPCLKASIVVGTGDPEQATPGSAAVYTWSGTDWVKVSPEPGEGLGGHIAVYCLCEFMGQLYAGTDGGQVYVYANGTTWTRTGLGGSEIPSQATILSLTPYLGGLYAGTRPAGLYRYDATASRWSKVDIDLCEMQGVVAMTTWTDPNAQALRLYLGDVYHDMVIAFNGWIGDKELSILAPTGSCIWDFQAFHDHLYACAYEGRIYVRETECLPGTQACWSLATPSARGYTNAWEMEVFQDRLYVACDGTLERLVAEESSWDSLTLERVFSVPMAEQGTDHIRAMTTAGALYFGTEHGRVYRLDGQEDPVQVGPALPCVFAIHGGGPLERSLKVDGLEIRLQGHLSGGGPLTYQIDFSLSGESAGTVTLLEELPTDVDLVGATPEPNDVSGRLLTWHLGRVEGETRRGVLSVTVRPRPGLPLGSELVSTVLILDGSLQMGGAQSRALYGVEHLFVDPNAAPPAPNGCSWDTAFTTLSEALRRAEAYRVPEVWVAQGVYELPERGQNGDPAQGLPLFPGLTLRGGFAGHEQSAAERDLAAHPTVLTCRGMSGTVLTVDAHRRPNQDPQCPTGILIDGVTFRGPGPGFQVDGIRATTDPHPLSNLTVRRCTFEECFHGLFLEDDSGVTLEDCLFSTTVFGLSASGSGAVVNLARCLFRENMCGAYLGEGASVTAQRCTFARNGLLSTWDDRYAGGMVAFCDKAEIKDCHFSENRARIGGGLYVCRAEGCADTQVRISGCEFVRNTVVRAPPLGDERSTGEGGGLFIDRRDFVVTDSWFVGNTSSVAAGALGCRQSSGQVVRTFFYGNQATGPTSWGGGALAAGYLQGPLGVYRSVFADNRAPYGGAVSCTANGDQPTDLANCTFLQNQGTYWAGGALSVCSEKVNPRTTVGSRAAVTDCLFYGNTGKVDGALIEVYAGGTLTLCASAMDGAWYQPAVVWVELDQQNRRLAQVEVNDLYAMPILSRSPFRPEVAMDCHLRPLQAAETAHPIDCGRGMTMEEVAQDVDGDPVPLGNGWDLGADEFNPNEDGPCQVWPPQVVCDCTAEGASDLSISFRSVRCAENGSPDPDRVELIRLSDPTPRVVASVPVLTGGPGVAIDESTPEGLASGRVTFSVADLDLRSGVYVAHVVQWGDRPVVKAASCRFFVRSVPPDPRTLTQEP